MNFEYDITYFSGFTLTVVFQYYYETPSTRYSKGTPEEIEIERIFYKGKELDMKDVDDHLLEATSDYLLSHLDDWYDPTFE